MPPNDIPDYRFGCEFEVILPRTNNGTAGRAALAQAITAAGHECRTEHYNHDPSERRTWWKIVTDVSIGQENAEVVAPILRGAAGLEEVKRVTRAMDDFGCRVNNRCGMHVHVGMRDQFASRVGVFKELIRTYHRFEPVLDQLTSPSRRGPNGGNGYCGGVRWNDRIEAATNLDQLRQAFPDRGKLNVSGAYYRHGTVEFRHHQGTVNGEKATYWILLCLRMVAHATKNTEVSRSSPREYRPLPSPFLPSEPRFEDPIDYARCERVRADAIPRFIRVNRYELRNLHISWVTPNTPRRYDTEGRENHDRHNRVGVNLWDYAHGGGRRTHLAWDVDHGYVHVVYVPATGAPRVAVAPDSDEDRRRQRLISEWRADRDRRIAEDAQAEAEHRARWEAENPAPPEAVPVVRPATDTTPVTLEGLFELLEMAPTERNFFAERQMELNG